ncbi:MAG TPA: sugar ABC transporter substrate-binding protein [Candidatus Eisenbergiella intestinipullorum]|nr:sugar ABC transporter substrate-binding protein [Candidatus Eisenbergiella intestinipullorum]
MKKKLLAAILTAAMLAGMTAGCGSSGSTADTGGSAAAQTTAASESAAPESVAAESEADGSTEAQEASGEQVTIKVAHWDSSLDPSTQMLIDGFEAANPNIKVELIDIASSEYSNKLTVMLNGGNDLDVVWIKDADNTPSIAQRGQLEDLTPYIERDGMDLAEMNGADALNLNGIQAALPVKTDFYVLYYNKDIFDAAGVEYPGNDMTWSEFEELATQMTSGEGNDKVYGAHFHTWQACVQNWAVQDGKHTILDTDYSFMKPYYEMALRMQDAGTVMDYSTLKTGNIAYASVFMEGQTAMIPMGTWLMSTIIEAKKNGETDINWGVATLPHPDDVEAGYTVGSTTPMGVNAASKHKDEAWEFVKFCSSEEGAKIYAEAGIIPARMNEETIKALAALDGMPEGLEEALQTKHVSLDRPLELHSAEVNQMLGEEHSLIMIKELSIDEGLAEMGERSKEIQGE